MFLTLTVPNLIKGTKSIFNCIHYKKDMKIMTKYMIETWNLKQKNKKTMDMNEIRLNTS